jgi:hypothetical protein
MNHQVNKSKIGPFSLKRHYFMKNPYKAWKQGKKSAKYAEKPSKPTPSYTTTWNMCMETPKKPTTQPHKIE